MLEDPDNGFLVNDTIIIKYEIELVVTHGKKTIHYFFKCNF